MRILNKFKIIVNIPLGDCMGDIIFVLTPHIFGVIGLENRSKLNVTITDIDRKQEYIYILHAKFLFIKKINCII
jgi:hypothetical protein